ncbi:hypothetical protein PR202_gb29602 [Eleusine coracana subsp. coracana]|uniref:Uncharacterized protein n=1 Tax=Eleusine coracana subsp. coracana TaxID=191504 RepID=A0AAV5G0P3_ELECO|nr:hypothetical protein PR202_gb29602 [Eleusine coracana subsp. coracana]
MEESGFNLRSGQLLAVAARSIINIFDVEKQANLHSPPKDHNSEINCICWDGSGEYLASMQELWSLGDNQRNPIQAHEGLIAALAHSLFIGMIASASHDRYVKLWK